MDIRSDNFLFSTRSADDFHAAVDQVEKATQWQDSAVDELKVIPVNYEPLFVGEYMKETGIKDESLLFDAMSTTGLVVKAGTYAAPLREIGIKSLLDRAKVNGAALFKISRNNFANIVNTCLGVQKEKCQIVTVGDKISAILSDNYVRVPATSVFNEAHKKITDKYSDAEFTSGFVCHTMFLANYLLNDDTLLDAYRNQFIDLCDWNVKPVLTIATSNTGDSGVNIYPKFQRGNSEFIIGGSLKMDHRGDASVEKFSENLEFIYSVFTKAIRNFANLCTIRIYNPVETFLNVAKRIGLPKKYAMAAAADFEAFLDTNYSNAHDIYMGLTETLFYAENDGKDKVFLANMQEILARALNINWKDYDTRSTEWQKPSAA